ncbi:TPA: type III secretion system translocon subunit SctE [Salmonella enterica subsp. enterica serovar Frintrop]
MNMATLNNALLFETFIKEKFDCSSKLFQLERFGNNALNNYAHANRVKEIVQTLPPEVVSKINESVIKKFNKNNLNSSRYPQLSPPKNDVVSQKGELNALKRSEGNIDGHYLAKLISLVQSLSSKKEIQKININARNYNMRMELFADEIVSLAKNFITATADVKANINKSVEQTVINGANSVTRNTPDSLSSLAEVVNNISEKIVKYKAELFWVPVNELQSKYSNLEQKVTSGEFIEIDDINSLVNKASEIFAQVASSLRESGHIDKATYLIALIAEAIDENAKDELQAAATLREKLSLAAARDAERKAKEYEQQVRKAEHMQKTMGCVGKILGWVATAVGVAAAIFSGGTSLALAGVGLALAVGDEIFHAATGHSFIQDGLQLIMKPVMKFMSNIIANLLEDFGVKGSIKDLLSNILGSVASSVVFIAGIAVAGSAIGAAGSAIGKAGSVFFKNVGEKLASAAVEAEFAVTYSKLASRIFSNSARKMIIDMLDMVYKGLKGGIGRAGGLSEERVAQISTYSQMGWRTLATLNSGLQMGGEIAADKMRLDAEKIKAKLQENLANQEVIKEMFDLALEYYRNRSISLNSIIESMSSVAENNFQTDKYIVQSMNSTFA